MTSVQYMTLRDVATAMSRDYRTVWGWAKDGKLPVVKMGGSVYVKQTEFEEWLKARQTNG